jgi:hypothetical protein
MALVSGTPKRKSAKSEPLVGKTAPVAELAAPVNV